jgi:hypothetical protein
MKAGNDPQWVRLTQRWLMSIFNPVSSFKFNELKTAPSDDHTPHFLSELAWLHKVLI